MRILARIKSVFKSAFYSTLYVISTAALIMIVATVIHNVRVDRILNPAGSVGIDTEWTTDGTSQEDIDNGNLIVFYTFDNGNRWYTNSAIMLQNDRIAYLASHKCCGSK